MIEDSSKYLRVQVHLTGAYAKVIARMAELGDTHPGAVVKRLVMNHLDKVIDAQPASPPKPLPGYLPPV